MEATKETQIREQMPPPRTSEHFPESDICPVCLTNKDGITVLCPIDGTDKDGICEAKPLHLTCAIVDHFNPVVNGGVFYKLTGR